MLQNGFKTCTHCFQQQLFNNNLKIALSSNYCNKIFCKYKSVPAWVILKLLKRNQKYCEI